MRRPDGAWKGLDGLDKLLAHQVRLALCVLLSRHDSLNFSRLKTLLDETDGSLGAHLKRLEDAGYLRVKKEFADRRPVSWYALTKKGKAALGRHLGGLDRLIRGADGVS